jgi:hypothetical protein
MKPLKIIGYIFFALGVICKFMHYPGAAVFMFLGVVLFCVCVFLSFIVKNKNTGKAKPDFVGLAVLFLFIYFLFRLQFWPSQTIFWILAGVASIVAIILFIRNKNKIKPAFIVMLMLLLLSEVSYFTPYSQMYYFINLNKVLNSEDREVYFVPWERYSWQLYWEGHYDEAIQANDSAMKALNFILSNHIGNLDTADMQLLRIHNQAIKNRNWNSFP